LSYASKTAAAVLRSGPLEVKGIGAHSPDEGGTQAFRSLRSSTNSTLAEQLDQFSSVRF